jgi:hypothetical protein
MPAIHWEFAQVRERLLRGLQLHDARQHVTILDGNAHAYVWRQLRWGGMGPSRPLQTRVRRPSSGGRRSYGAVPYATTHPFGVARYTLPFGPMAGTE